MKHLFLIGFMGSGKSTLAPLLSKTLHLPYLSIDSLIEHQEQKSISLIFNHKGEDYFRKLEREILQDLLHLDTRLIIDCGGGLPIFNSISSLGIVIFLDIDFDVLISRMSLEQTKRRPLFQNYDRAYGLYQQRRGIYLEQADIVVDASLETYKIAEEIQKRLKNENLFS